MSVVIADRDSSFCALERFMKEETKGCFADSAFFSNECESSYIYVIYRSDVITQ